MIENLKALFPFILNYNIYQLMGNSNDTTSEIDNYNHPRLGTIKRIQQKNSNQYIGYQIVIQNQKIYDEWDKQLRFIKTQQSVDQILFLPLDYSFKQTAYCGTGGLASLRYQDYLYSLLPEIINRRQIKRPFNQQELLYLFYSLVKISSILQKKNRVIGDIKPQNILVNQDGYIKVISQISWPGQPNKFIKGWDKSNERLLLSPEECEQRQKKKQAIIYNPLDSCSEVFSIGVTILEAGTLRDCSEIYGDTYEYKFSQVKVRQYLDIFETRYSKQLSEIVRQMLHPNPKRRCKTQQIYKSLKPYQYQILNLEQISLEVESTLFVPKIERQQKISIKKMGDSNHGTYESHHSNSEFHHSNKSSHLNEASYSNLKQTLQPIYIQNPPYVSSIPYVRESFNNHRNLNNVQGSTYYPQTKPINYQLINDNTVFGRPLLAQSYNPHALKPINYMASSLPLKLSQHSQSNISGPQYITQNSMITTIGQHDTSYVLGNPRPFANY